MNSSSWTHVLRGLGLGAALFLGGSALQAADLCVNPGGKGGCFTTIGAAVTAASPNGVIRVAKGTYHETVIITQSLSLLGEGAQNTIIDATNLLNGINIDGCNFTAGSCNYRNLAHVIVSGFTVQNANAQGILVTNASDVTISNNHLTGNDRSLAFPNCPAPGFPVYFEAGEGFDCGEAIHLSGVDHSIVANNLVERNAGGILLSDDTGQTHDNLLSGNVVQNNPFDCGITLASHNISTPAYTPSTPPGVFHNRIIGNTSASNGLISGEGAGVGIFAAAPGAANYGNTVSGNVLTGNALPGVAIHSHAPGQVVKDHIITGNQISGNGADGDLGPSLPTMGISITNYPPVPTAAITGIVISQNIFKGEGMDIAVKTNFDSTVDAHFNSFFGAVGVGNLGLGSISATANWWKCSNGPGANGCSATQGSNITTDPWLTSPFKD